MKVPSAQHYDIFNKKLMPDFDFDPKNGLGTVDLAKSTNFVSIGASFKKWWSFQIKALIQRKGKVKLSFWNHLKCTKLSMNAI